jgi:beta-glucosidase
MVTSGITGLCLDDFQSGTGNGNKVDINTCNASTAQVWTTAADGTVRAFGKCLQVTGGGTASGTTVELDACVTGSAAQQWAVGPDGWVLNPASGKCLTDPGNTTTDSTQQQIAACAGATGQKWALPSTTAPAAPTAISVTAGAGSATLAWTPPASTGGPPLTG